MSARAEMKTEAFMIARKLAMLRWFALELRWHTHQFQLVRSLCMGWRVESRLARRSDPTPTSQLGVKANFEFR